MSLVYLDKIPTLSRLSVEQKVRDIADRLEIDPNWLMIIFNYETAGQISPSTTNSIGCVGLIQFCPDKAGTKKVGNTVYTMNEIRSMSYSRQLELVYEFLKVYQNKVETIYDLYTSIFYPTALGKPNSYIFGSEKSDSYARIVAQQNPSIANGDTYITRKNIIRIIDIQMKKANYTVTKVDSFIATGKMLKRNKYAILFSALGVGLLTYVLLSDRK